MNIVVNGQERAVSPGLTVEGLLRDLGLAGARVAVERNREIVTRALYAGARLDDGDRIEIVQMVGGG